MGVVLRKKDQIGPGVTAYDFEVHKNDVEDSAVYDRGRELEKSLTERQDREPAETDDES